MYTWGNGQLEGFMSIGKPPLCYEIAAAILGTLVCLVVFGPFAAIIWWLS